MAGLLQKYKLYLLAGGGLLAVLLALQIFSGGDEGQATVTMQTNTGTISPENAAIEQELLTQLLQLSTITLDDRVFSNPAFVSLEDFSQPIQPQPVGRPNPFAPIAITTPPPVQNETTATSTRDALQNELEPAE